METREEQAMYGDHCVHGTAIGTPGGYDLMCGLCEDGLTKPVRVERKRIMQSFGGAHPSEWMMWYPKYMTDQEAWDKAFNTFKNIGEEHWPILTRHGFEHWVLVDHITEWVDPYETN